MKLKLKTLLILSLAVASGILLLYTSQAVQNAERDLRTAQSRLAKEQETIRVLDAEWAFLSAPDRLEKLARKYLGMPDEKPAIIAEETLKIPAHPELHKATYSGGEEL